MGDWLQEYKQQIKELWNKLSKRAQIVIAIGLIGIIILFLILIFGTGSPAYQALFSHLEPRDGNAIINRLEEKGQSYQLSDDGRTIMVPAADVHKIRLDMAGEGLPAQGVVGFEIFDQSKFGTTDFERQVNYYRALGGELSRSIQAIETVEFARVQITAPRESLFIEKEQQASASVLLKLVPGFQINNQQVKAISNLVAGSVQALEAEKVTIVDTSGNLLSQSFAKKDSYDQQLALTQLAIERQFAQGLKTDLQALLNRVLGPDNYTIQVKANMNFDQKEVESIEYYPVVDEQGIIRSQQELRESFEGIDSGASGAPGVSSNIPQYQSPASEETSSYRSSEIITNYEINERIERKVYAPGTVEQISVAVIVNEQLNPAEQAEITNALQTAIGYDINRGDLVTVSSLSFDDSLEEQIQQAQIAQTEREKREMYIYAGLISLILLILLILIISLRQPSKEVVQETVQPQNLDVTVDDSLDKLEEELAATNLSTEEKKLKKMKEEIASLVSKKPEEVANILKNWLQEK